MVTGVDLDPSRQAVLRATVAFAREVGARVVAEGVERPEELDDPARRGGRLRPGLAVRPPRRGVARRAPAAARPPPRPPAGALERDLAAATDAREASEVVVEHLARKGLMPSVYLEQGGRLRCQAVRGYWQVFDGMPATAGVIGRTFRTGEPTIVDDVAATTRLPARRRLGPRRGLLAAARAAAASSACSTPSRRPRPATPRIAEIERCAELLSAASRRSAARPVSPAQRLARIAVRLGSLEDPEDIVRETVAAARALAGFESAMLALPTATAASTSTTPRARSRSRSARSRRPTSRRSPPGSTRAPPATRPATAAAAASRATRCCASAGANAVIVLPLVAAGERHGLLLVADRANHRIDTENAELLELLAGQAAGSLRMAAAVPELRERAARDPLTGLGHHATFYAEVPARARPRGRRRAWC